MCFETISLQQILCPSRHLGTSDNFWQMVFNASELKAQVHNMYCYKAFSVHLLSSWLIHVQLLINNGQMEFDKTSHAASPLNVLNSLPFQVGRLTKVSIVVWCMILDPLGLL